MMKVNESSTNVTNGTKTYTIRLATSEMELRLVADVINVAFAKAYEHVRSNDAPTRTTYTKVKAQVESLGCKVWVIHEVSKKDMNEEQEQVDILGTIIVPSPHLDFDTASREDTESFGSLSVLPSYQGLGLGKMLVKYIEHRSKTIDKKIKIELCYGHGTLLNNKPQLKEFYTSMGYYEGERKGRKEWFNILPDYRNGLYFQQMMKEL
jgi:GNAT superfamily N-acetyltransferase